MSIIIFRYLSFPFASHPTFSSDAVKVRLAVVGYRSRNLTHIALDLVKAHSYLKCCVNNKDEAITHAVYGGATFGFLPRGFLRADSFRQPPPAPPS